MNKVGCYVSYVGKERKYHPSNFSKAEIVEIDPSIPNLYYVKIIEVYERDKTYVNKKIAIYQEDMCKWIKPNGEILVYDLLIGKEKLKENIWYTQEFKKYPEKAFKLSNGTLYITDIIDNEIYNIRKYENLSLSLRKDNEKIYELNMVTKQFGIEIVDSNKINNHEMYDKNGVYKLDKCIGGD